MTEERSKIMDDLIAQDADLIDNPLAAAVRELLTDDSQVDLGAFINDLLEALDRHGLQVVSQIYIDWQNDTIEECKDQNKDLEKVARAVISYAKSGGDDYLVEQARAALGEQQ
jgi:hypothetical protein